MILDHLRQILNGTSRHWRRIPYVAQSGIQDCGAACLTMVLRYHGKHVRKIDVQDLLQSRSAGASAADLLEAGKQLGLEGRGVALECDAIESLAPGSILHWHSHHFVVLASARPQKVQIIDPAQGRRSISRNELEKSFSNVALTFEPAEDFRPDPGSSDRLWQYLKQILTQKGTLARIIITSVLIQLFALALPVLTGLIVDRVVPQRDHDLLLLLAAGMGVLVTYQFIASILRAHLLLYLRTRLDFKLTMDFLQHMLALPFGFFRKRSAGDLMMRLNSNAVVRDILTNSAMSALLDGLLVTTYLALIFFTSPPMGFLVLLLGSLQIATFTATRKKQRELMAESLQIQAASQSYQVQMFGGIEIFKASGAEQRAIEQFEHHYIDVLNQGLRVGRLSAWVEAVLGGIRMASPLSILLWGAVQVVNGSLSMGTMLAVAALAGGFLSPIAALVGVALKLLTAGTYLDRIDEVLGTEKEQDADGVRAAPRLAGSIELHGVGFRYGLHSEPALTDINLRIESGQLVALVGRSGSGKTTLANLIAGLYMPTHGTVLLDGNDLREMDLSSVREQLGVVTQSTILFGASVRSNIALTDPTVSLEEIRQASRIAEIDKEIQAKPLGYDTSIADGGMSLSGGQRQRVALARALVGRPSILLLDEATSALDAITERKIHDNLAALNCTRIVIAHRLSTIERADVIVVLEDGRIVETGIHPDLVAAGGAYAELVASQMREIDSAPGLPPFGGIVNRENL